jgi:hypothetical protein
MARKTGHDFWSSLFRRVFHFLSPPLSPLLLRGKHTWEATEVVRELAQPPRAGVKIPHVLYHPEPPAAPNFAGAIVLGAHAPMGVQDCCAKRRLQEHIFLDFDLRALNDYDRRESSRHEHESPARLSNSRLSRAYLASYGAAKTSLL